MKLRYAVLLLAVSAPPLAGCGASTEENRPRANAKEDAPREGIGGGGDRGATTRDMPGRGRGSDPVKVR